MILRFNSAAFLCLSPVVLAASSTVTIYTQAVPDRKPPAPIIQLAYDSTTLIANVTSYKSPIVPHVNNFPVRVGLYESSGANAGTWSSAVLTAGSSFDDKYQKHVALYVDGRGYIWGIGFSTSLKDSTLNGGKNSKSTKQDKSKGASKGQGHGIVVEVIKQTQGPDPILNKPVVLNPDGKVEQKEPEKTLFQKYWWVLALFLVLNLAAGGGEK